MRHNVTAAAVTLFLVYAVGEYFMQHCKNGALMHLGLVVHSPVSRRIFKICGCKLVSNSSDEGGVCHRHLLVEQMSDHLIVHTVHTPAICPAIPSPS